jgi:hypothetical protein
MISDENGTITSGFQQGSQGNELPLCTSRLKTLDEAKYGLARRHMVSFNDFPLLIDDAMWMCGCHLSRV